MLTEEAYERLKTIGEATELGSGFKIAMRDLEIRGAGNLLGESQSGHIAAVGYDLYCQMVTEAVAEMKGEPVKQPSEIKLDVPTDAFLPADYVAKEELRLEAYRRLADVTTQADVDDIRAEWEDRYGPLPDPAEALLMVGRLRAECHRLGIVDMQITGTKREGGQARLSPIELKLSRVDAAEAAVEGCDPQGGPAPARGADPARPGPGRVPRRLPRPADPAGLTHSGSGRAPTAGSVSAVLRRHAVRLAVRVAVLAARVAVAATGCTTFSDNDAVARVGDVELSSDELDRAAVDARRQADVTADRRTAADGERRVDRLDPHRARSARSPSWAGATLDRSANGDRRGRASIACVFAARTRRERRRRSAARLDDGRGAGDDVVGPLAAGARLRQPARRASRSAPPSLDVAPSPAVTDVARARCRPDGSSAVIDCRRRSWWSRLRELAERRRAASS